jgi:uncharacterized repeat protein (TIGR03803 family)
MIHSRLLALAAILGVPSLGTLPAGASADVVSETVMNAFGAPTAGGQPVVGAPTLGKDGNLYGLTQRGGGSCFCGAAYRLAPDGTLTQLYAFQGNGDGAEPAWGLARDNAGNLYGMAGQDESGTNRGTVFKLTESGTFTVLHRFPFDTNGGSVFENAVTVGRDGFLYGTTFEGGGASDGCGTAGCGVIFRMKTNGSGFAIVYRFPGTPPTPGYTFGYPLAGLAPGSDGALYGLTQDGANEYGFQSSGSLYRFDPATATVTQLHQFTDIDMETPSGMPALDAANNLYILGAPRIVGMTGRIYKLDTSGTLSTLHQFAPPEGVPGNPDAPMLLGADGRFYGTTVAGGSQGGNGTVFSLGLDGTFATLYNFTDVAPDGFSPGGLVAAKDGSLWGTTADGGAFSGGTAFRLAKPTEKFKVRPTLITLGQSAVLSWTSTDTANCEASGAWGPASLPASGSQKVKPGAAGVYSYTLECSGAGSIQRTVQLTVQ